MSESEKFIPRHLEFSQFWSYIAHQLGSSRLKIISDAADIHGLIDSNADIEDYLKNAIKESYKRSQCNNLRNPVSLDAVLDILGEIAFSLRNNHLDDLLDIELLEEIAWHIDNRYRQYLDLDPEPSQSHKGQLISFPQYKIRIANIRG
ncbi:MAG: hypothetical protein KTR16_09250 [Acidiferrobacterales bacterium]|nr:hypothetical protein [Acidiferrobacterales bacterium]